MLALMPLVAAPYGSAEEWWKASFECAIFALAALSGIEWLLSARREAKHLRLLLPLILLLVFVFAQTIPFGSIETQGIESLRTLSLNAYETRLVAFHLFALILALGILFRYTTNRLRLRALILTVLGVCLLSAVFGIVRQLGHSKTQGFLLPALQPSEGYGQFINRNHFAFLMEMGLGLALGLIAGKGEKRNRGRSLFIYIYSGAVIWLALVLSNSRGGILSLLGQLLFITLLFSFVHSRRNVADSPTGLAGLFVRLSRSILVRAALISLLMLATFLTIIWMGGDPVVERLKTLPGEVSSDRIENRNYKSRLDYWRTTWNLIKANPVAGSGFGSFGIAITEYFDASGKVVPQEAHNDYLEMFASGGVIGIGLGLWFAVLFVSRARKTLQSRSTFRRAACYGALAGIVGTAIHSIFDFGLHNLANGFVFVALIVIATVNIQSDSGQKVSSPADGADTALQPESNPGPVRYAAAAVGLFICLFCIWIVWREGQSRRWSYHAVEEGSLEAANRAVALAPTDPLAHRARAIAFLNQDMLTEAVEEYRQAVALRPHDYQLWSSLGLARMQQGDFDQATTAFIEAARLAPYFGQPRWEYGMLLLSTGQYDQAFSELRLASASDPDLFPPIIGFAWDIFGGDAQAILRAIQPQTEAARLALARSFLTHEKTAEAFELFNLTETETIEDRRNLLAALLSARRFNEAYEVWQTLQGAKQGERQSGIARISEAGFEGRTRFEKSGFDWQIGENLGAFRAVQDALAPHGGARSLRLEFDGDSPLSIPLVSQLVLVEPGTKYRLKFAARCQDVVIGGSIYVTVTDAANGEKTLGQSPQMPQGTIGWEDYTLEFKTGETTNAVRIAIIRQDCKAALCRAFGRLWFDDFSLERL